MSRPQSSLAQWGASAAMQVVSRRQSEVRVPWLHNLTAAQDEDHDDQTDTEGEESEEEEDSAAEENTLSEVRESPGAWGPWPMMGDKQRQMKVTTPSPKHFQVTLS